MIPLALVVVSNGKATPPNEGTAIVCGLCLVLLTLVVLHVITDARIWLRIAGWLAFAFFFLALLGGMIAGIRGCQANRTQAVEVSP